MWKTIKGIVWVALLKLFSLWNRLKVLLGLLPVKYNIHGHYVYKSLHFSSLFNDKKRIDACEEFDEFRADDVVLMTYPKTGTHFTGEILISIYKEKGLIDSKSSLNNAVLPLEASPPALFLSPKKVKGRHPLSNIMEQKSPRLIATHLPWSFLPPSVREGKVKVIHCYRNPKDVVCSYYPFISNMGLLASGHTWKEFVERFIYGTVLYGGYMSWLKQWYPHRNNSNTLNLQFEDMKKDLRGSVERIAKFLDVELTPDQIDNVVAANTFERKKKDAGKTTFVYRKGKSGGWKSDISVEQNEMLDEWIEDEMKDMPDLHFQCLQ